jgi:circadian clock protein KaiC
MTSNSNVPIVRLANNVPGLDELLGGGLPEYSFNVITGSPGSGKTTLAHQIMFSMATPNSRALFFTVQGEPPLKMLRYQQQFSFFDVDKVNLSIRFVSLSTPFLNGDYDAVLERILQEVQQDTPCFVFIDSFRALSHGIAKTPPLGNELQLFVEQLGQHMTSWQATTFLICDYSINESQSNPVFTVADGIIAMSQNLLRSSIVRKIQIVKMRGQAHKPGLHTFRIDETGLNIFPRAFTPVDAAQLPYPLPADIRLSMGTPGLDDMMGGGLPIGYSLLLVGPSGCGKTVLATEFLIEGVRVGEPGVIAAFEKSPNQLLSKKLSLLVTAGKVGIIDTHALDLSIDETLYDLITMIQKMKAKRVVIDSLSGFELALAPEFREDYRESLYRMISVLTSMGVTILMTAELEDRYTDLRFSSYGNAFLADAIILQRYTELDGQFRRVMSVVKVRGSAHSKDICLFDISNDGIQIGSPLFQYHGILAGQPRDSRAAPDGNH